MPEQVTPPKYRRSWLQKACMGVMLTLFVAALAAAAAFTFLDLPPVSWLNSAQDAILGWHYPMIGFVLMMLIAVAVVIPVSFIIIRMARA